MYLLSDVWTWDSWFVDDGERFHAFYLKASKALIDPDRRHQRASVGHAISDDLRTWNEMPDAFVHSDGPAFDDLAIWTGSIVQGPDRLWRFFYTACSRGDRIVQRLGLATSPDLTTWTRDPGWEVIEADERYYEKHGDSGWFDEAWRDPWVYPDPAGEGWHMLITARAPHGELHHRGVVGHATSPDLATWTVQPPLSTPDAGFGQLEVLQLAEVDGRWVLVFSCLQAELSEERRLAERGGGIWAVSVDSPSGPFDVSRATLLTGPELYAGRLIQDRTGQWNLMAFHNIDDDGRFIGALSEPIPVAWDGERLALAVDITTT